MSRRSRLRLIPLEDRLAPATLYTVNSSADTNARDGVLTLREALLAERGDLTGWTPARPPRCRRAPPA